jgi:hypothetical protein
MGARLPAPKKPIKWSLGCLVWTDHPDELATRLPAAPNSLKRRERGGLSTTLVIPESTLKRFLVVLWDLLKVFYDLGMDQGDSSYAAVILARSHKRCFDRYLAEPFLEAVARGAAECYEANRVQIEALDPGQQQYHCRQLYRLWLVAVIKEIPSELEPFVRRAEFEEAMDSCSSKAVADSRESTADAPATGAQPPTAEESQETGPSRVDSSGPADPTPAASTLEETERLVRAALSKGDQPAVETALAELWGEGWSINSCAQESGVDRGTVRHMIRGLNIREKKRMKIVEAFHKRRPW